MSIDSTHVPRTSQDRTAPSPRRPRSPRRRLLHLAVAVSAGLLALGGSALAAPSTRTVKVVLGAPSEFAVAATPGVIAPGKVTLSVVNRGKITHELNIIRVASATTILPKGRTAGQRLQKGTLGSVEGLRPGKNGAVTVVLTRGTYQLYCNIPGHYMAGMRTTIRVS